MSLDVEQSILCSDEDYSVAHRRALKLFDRPSNRQIRLVHPVTKASYRHLIHADVLTEASVVMKRLVNSIEYGHIRYAMTCIHWPHSSSESRCGGPGTIAHAIMSLAPECAGCNLIRTRMQDIDLPPGSDYVFEFDDMELEGEHPQVVEHFLLSLYFGSLRAALRALGTPLTETKRPPPTAPKAMRSRNVLDVRGPRVRVYLDMVYDVARLALDMGVTWIYKEAHGIWFDFVASLSYDKDLRNGRVRYIGHDGPRRQRLTSLDLVTAFHHVMSDTKMEQRRRIDFAGLIGYCVLHSDIRKFAQLYDVCPVYWKGLADDGYFVIPEYFKKEHLSDGKRLEDPRREWPADCKIFWDAFAQTVRDMKRERRPPLYAGIIWGQNSYLASATFSVRDERRVRWAKKGKWMLQET